jgi:hypothetical protein
MRTILKKIKINKNKNILYHIILYIYIYIYIDWDPGEVKPLTQIYHKKYMVFVSFKPSPSLNVNGFFLLLQAFFLESHPMYDQTQCSGAVFSLLYK